MPFRWIGLMFLWVGLIACQNLPAEDTRGSLGSAPLNPTVAPTAVPVPRLTLSPREGAPGAEIIAVASNLPPGGTYFLRFGLGELGLTAPLHQVQADSDGNFALELLMPILGDGQDLSGKGVVEVIVQDSFGETLAEATFGLNFRDGFKRYDDLDAGFSLLIPAHWETTEPRLTPLGVMTLLGPPPIVPGDPAVNMILVANLEDLDANQASELLMCGAIGCRDRLLMFKDQVGEFEARSLVIGTDQTPQFEWFFLTHEGRLIYFTLHDPVTLKTLRPLVNSFSLESPASVATPVIEDAPEATPTAAPTPTRAAGPTAAAPTSHPEEDIGPMQTVIDFLTIVVREQLDGQAAEFFSSAQRQTIQTAGDMFDLLQIDFVPVSFSTERILTEAAPVKIRVVLRRSSIEQIRLFMLIEEDARWRIDRIETVDSD